MAGLVGQAKWLAAAAVVAVALAVAAAGGGGFPAELPPSIRAEFGRCHEGGGTNCVVDGDTVWITGRKVRIAGIDAPETHEPKCPQEAVLGKASADRLQALLNSGTVTATRTGRDRDPNDRLLRNISVDGRDVGQVLVAAGLARRYGGGKKSWC
jgi:endonuclease YncB( thermonuclease family)